MRFRALAVVLVVAAAIVPFSPALRFDGFLGWDDPDRVVDNPYVNPPSFTGLVRLWGGTYFGEYAPVAQSLLALQAALAHEPGTGRVNLRLDGERPRAELDARVFHAGSLLLHAAASVLSCWSCCACASTWSRRFCVRCIHSASRAWCGSRRCAESRAACSDGRQSWPIWAGRSGGLGANRAARPSTTGGVCSWEPAPLHSPCCAACGPAW